MSLRLTPVGRKIVALVAIVLFSAAGIFFGKENFVIFHSAVELACIALAFSIYITTKNTHKVSQNNYFLFLGSVFLLISTFDFLHLLTYGSNVMLNNMTLEFRIISRYFQASSLIIFCILLRRQDRPIKIKYLLNIYYIAAVLILAAIANGRILPVLYKEGRGFTAAKSLNELAICVLLVISLILIIRNKKKIYEDITLYLFCSVFILIISEICFAFYNSPSDSTNLAGHILKLGSYYLIYKAIIQTTLENPYNLLFYKLTEINSSLEIKTRLLMQINKKLNDEIEERKSIEEKLKVSKKSYQELLDFLPYAVLAHSQRKIVYVNNAALELLKASDYKELLDKDMLDIIHPDFHEIAIKRMEEVYKNRQSKLEELKFITIDKKTIDVETKAVPHVFKDKVSGLVVIRDISERKEAEQKEKELKEAMEYDRIKNEFMANISHELRTPLNVIFSSAQIIELYSQNNNNGKNSKKITKYSKGLKQNCYRMLRLVNNLIDLTKIDSGFLKLRLQNHNIVSIVEDITLSVAEYIESKKITVEFDTDTEERYMACDVDMIERILLNLLSNSVKFTPADGNIWVNISDNEDYILISVKDSGIGIPADKLEVIFDRFRQVDKSLTRNAEGSGIGLNLVKSLIELHGGEIQVKSTEGLGSEFIIKLPVVLVASDEAAAAIDPPQGNVERINIEFSDIYNY